MELKFNFNSDFPYKYKPPFRDNVREAKARSQGNNKLIGNIEPKNQL